jgi:porin
LRSFDRVFLAASTAITLVAPAEAVDLSDRLSLEGVLAAAGQCHEADPASSGVCKGALPLQVEARFHATESDELAVKLGFAVGNGLNIDTEFAFAPWAADLEDDVQDINGSGRDYLLTAWYRRSFQFGDRSELAASIGLVDATDYIDDNAYSTDEYTQFMNQGLVDGPNTFLPSYEPGAALAWNRGPWSASAVYMDVGDDGEGNAYRLLAGELGYRFGSSLGEGNYRVITGRTSDDLPAPDGTGGENRTFLIFSLDQEFGQSLGGFLRIGWQNKDAAVDYEAVYSGGLNIEGEHWGREEDTIGAGYAYLDGGSDDIDHTHIAELYYRFAANDQIALTGDVQFMDDRYKAGGGPRGWVFGMRATVAF